MISSPFGKDLGSMNVDLENYTYYQMNNIDSNASTLRAGITEIAENYGYDDIKININSQFGEDQMPMEVTVDGVSMVPTLQDGENVIIQKKQKKS